MLCYHSQLFLDYKQTVKKGQTGPTLPFLPFFFLEGNFPHLISVLNQKMNDFYLQGNGELYT